MNSNYRIRPAKSSDLMLLPRIEREAAGRFNPYGLDKVMSAVISSAEDFQAAYAAERLWVAADAEGQPVGFALATIVGDNAHLDELDILSEHGRQGLGSRLVQAVHQWSAGHGLPAVTLTTLDNIPWNRPFYEKLGYRTVSEENLSGALRRLLQAEIERGLPSENRIAMVCDL